MYSDDIIACAKLVERGDPLRFRAVMASPAALRPALFTLFAFNVEVARAPWITKEAMIAEMRLQWWHDALGEIANGDLVRRHEVVTPLAYFITPDQARLLQHLVDARRWDIYSDPFADKDAFDTYLMNTSGNLYAVAANILGPCDLNVVQRLGSAFGFAQFMHAIPALQNAGKRPLDDGRTKTLAERAREAQGTLRLRAQVSKPAKWALLSGYQTEWSVQQIIKTPQRVIDGIGTPSPFMDRYLFIKARF
jgi:phytoene/squalene synthetase